MAGKSKKDKAQKHKKMAASIVYALLFVCVTVFVIGCEESSQTFGDYNATNIASPRQEAYRIIQNALDDTNPVARVNAIEVVATTGQIKFMPNVQRLLQDEFTPVRFAAALAVGDMRYSRAKNSLSPLLKDKDVNVIVAASYAMGRLGSAEYFEVIRKSLNSKDHTVKSNAAFLLGKTGDKGSLSLLKSAQEDKNINDKVRFQILEARARLGDDEVLQKLWAIVYSAFADDRIMGIRAMGLLGTSKARDILVTKLDDNVLEVRLAAAGQLGRLRDRIGESEVLDVFEKNLIAGL
ncbi:MAG: HEAT repeat domain-containing protein, partial [Planctomycetota bacterium]